MAAKDLGNIDTKKQEELEDITTCSICTETYTDPKALPCIHTFCMKCIEAIGLKTDKGPGDEMPCPICRRLFKIPAEGLHGLPKHFFIERLIQLSKISDLFAVTKVLCSVCLEESNEREGTEIQTAATYYCDDCKHKLCEECGKEHRQFKLTKNHKLMPISEYERGQTLVTHLVCEVHEQKILDVFCTDCKTVVCAICFIEEHKNHEGSHVNKCLDGFRKQIESYTKEMNESIAEAQVKKAEIMKIKEDMHQRVESLEVDVERRKVEIIQLAEKHASCLLEDLCCERESRLKEMQMATDDTDEYILNLESYNSYCREILDKGSASDICSALSDLSLRALELQQARQPVIERDIPDFRFFFSQTELEEFLDEDCGNLVGEIHDEQRNNSDPVLIHTIRTQAAEEKEIYIRGLAIIGNELFVMSDLSSEVEVYDTMKFTFSRRWNLRELINPRDIASCIRIRCLYIFDFSGFGGMSNAIWRVDPDGNAVSNWSTGIGSGRLSVTDELTVVFVSYNQHRLIEYSSDGHLIREINLSSAAGIHYPLHAIKLTNGHFVVSHSYHLHRVCIVDSDGTLHKSFGGKQGFAIGQLNSPACLSVDGNGFVMVADQGNGRVLLLDPDLEFNTEILSKEKHGFQFPSRILLDESNGGLFVVDNESNNGSILIFNYEE